MTRQKSDPKAVFDFNSYCVPLSEWADCPKQ